MIRARSPGGGRRATVAAFGTAITTVTAAAGRRGTVVAIVAAAAAAACSLASAACQTGEAGCRGRRGKGDLGRPGGEVARGGGRVGRADAQDGGGRRSSGRDDGSLDDHRVGPEVVIVVPRSGVVVVLRPSGRVRARGRAGAGVGSGAADDDGRASRVGAAHGTITLVRQRVAVISGIAVSVAVAAFCAGGHAFSCAAVLALSARIAGAADLVAG